MSGDKQKLVSFLSKVFICSAVYGIKLDAVQLRTGGRFSER